MGITVIHSVKLFDGDKVWPNAAVSFESITGKILSVSTSGNAANAEDVVVIDGDGHTLLPGLIEGHMHADTPHIPAGETSDINLTMPLKCGVTTLCDMHSDPQRIEAFRQSIRQEAKEARATNALVTRTDLKSALFAATIDGGWPKPIALHGHDTPEEREKLAHWPKVTIENAPDFVKSNKKLGADYIKLMQENCCSVTLPADTMPVPTLCLQKAVVSAAHQEGFVTVGHAFDLENTKILLHAGIDGLAHTFMDQAPTDELFDLYRQSNAFVIPTLTMIASLTGEEQELRDKYAKIGSDRGVLNETLRDIKSGCLGAGAPQSKICHAYDTITRLHKAGIDVVAGTDSIIGVKGLALGPSMWMELEMLVTKCGFTVPEALAAATSVSARRFHFDDRGVVEAGKRADLLLVKGDVTKDLQAMWTGDGIVRIWKDGLMAGY